MTPKNPLQDLASKLISYKNDPVSFVHNIIGAVPDPWQIEALQALAAGKNVAIRSGNGVGKSALLAWIIIWYLCTRPYPKVPATAPTQHQLRDVLWSEISYWLSRSKVKDILVWSGERVGFIGKEESWYAVARTSTTKESLAGFHADHLLFVIDEGSGVDDAIYEAVDGALSTEGAQCIMAGNPTRLSGRFHDAFTKDKKHWHCIQVSCCDSPRVTKKSIEEKADKYGRDSDYFRVHVLGEFPRADSDGFIPLDLAEAAAQRYHDYSPYDDDPVEIGVDVARFGSDMTGICVRKGGKVLLLESHSKLATTRTSAIVVERIREYGATRAKIDDGGVGGGVTDQLREMDDLDCEIVAVNFGATSPDDHYADYSTFMWSVVKDLLISGDIAIPNDPDLISQLTSRRYQLNERGKIKLERKADLRSRKIPSPDKADCLALAFAPEPQFEPFIF